MLTEKQFEDLMNHRYFEPPSADFAERIIASATQKRGYSGAGILAYFREVIESVIPKPSYAFALVLAVGVVIGLSLPVRGTNDEFAIYEEESTL